MHKFLFPALLAAGLGLTGPATAAGSIGADAHLTLTPVYRVIAFTNDSEAGVPGNVLIEEQLIGFRPVPGPFEYPNAAKFDQKDYGYAVP